MAFSGKDIRSSHVFLWDVIKRVQAGVYVPAAFQRPYVWERKDVEAFWDSILDGFPIGSLVTWDPYGAYDIGKVARGRLGPIEAAGFDATGVILDGQNRLATMAWSMWEPGDPVPADPSPQEEATWTSGLRLTADAETKRISFVPEREAETGLRMPVSALCRRNEFNHYVRTHFDRLTGDPNHQDDPLRWLDHCRNSLFEARLVMTSIENATPEEAKRAFLKVCRVGVPMAEEDFDRAMTWEEEPPTPGQ